MYVSHQPALHMPSISYYCCDHYFMDLKVRVSCNPGCLALLVQLPLPPVHAGTDFRIATPHPTMQVIWHETPSWF